MSHRRGSVFLVAPLLVLALFLVGCPKRPATMRADVAPPPPTVTPPPSVTPPPTVTPPPSVTPPSTVTPPPTGPTPTPPQPPRVSEFTENPNLKDIHFDFDKYNI